MAISNLGNIKTYLGIESDNTADDTLLASLMAKAQGIIERETGKKFDVSVETTLSFTNDNVDGGKLFFDEMCAAITTVTNGDGVVIASTQFDTMPKRHAPYYGIQLRWDANVVWDTWDSDITVKGKWGYSTVAPADIVQACDRLTMYLYRTKDNADVDKILFTDYGKVVSSAIPSDVRRTLSYYANKV